VSISVHFLSEDQVTQIPIVIAVQVATEIKVPLFVGGEVDNGHCKALLQI
jgi:hypothetical protein